MVQTARGTYADRLAAEIASRLPEDVDVRNWQGTLVFERGNARTLASPRYGKDKRRAVTEEDTRDALRIAASRLAGDAPLFRPEFVQPARELVDILRTASQ